MNNNISYILDGYDQCLEDLKELDTLVMNVINQAFDQKRSRIPIIQHRVKTRESLEGKLRRRNENFSEITDLRDLVGIRLICYYSDDVNNVAAVVRDLFSVDWVHSTDRRELIDTTQFGYVSLHYSCRLPHDVGYPEHLYRYRFEIQMCTMLQHTWAEIEHDLGYKNEYELPRSIRRDFSKVAGLLEVADDYFVKLRDQVNEYETQTIREIRSGDAGDIPIDQVTLSEFLLQSPCVEELNAQIQSRYGREVSYSNPAGYIKSLEMLALHTLGDIETMIGEEKEHLFDILDSTTGGDDADRFFNTNIIYCVIYACLVFGRYNDKDLHDIFGCSIKAEGRIKRKVEEVKNDRKELGLA
jgi:putative GTP pyrophosphokinase